MADAIRATTGRVRTEDGVVLEYSQYGHSSKPNLVFISGWCQTAMQWRKQYEALANSFHITTYDHRGHGESEKTNRGYSISRLAADLNELLDQLDLTGATLVGHSMGCPVIWALWDQYPTSRRRLESLVLIDHSSCLLAKPGWSEETIRQIGPVFTQTSLQAIVLALQGPDPDQFFTNFAPRLFTSEIPGEDLEWMIGRMKLTDPENAATLLLDNAQHDWSDLMATINVPTLIVGAHGGSCPVAGLEWQKERIPGAEIKVFAKGNGGSHFMFWENAESFNEVLRLFVEKR